SGKVKTITEYGRIQVPAAEVERILGGAARYEGQKRPLPRTKEDFLERREELQAAWRQFIANRHDGKGRRKKPPRRVPKPGKGDPDSRQGALGRLLRAGRNRQ